METHSPSRKVVVALGRHRMLAEKRVGGPGRQRSGQAAEMATREAARGRGMKWIGKR